MVKFTLEQVKAAKGALQGYFNRLLLEPIFDRSTWIIANFTYLTPNQISFIGFCFGLLSALSFASEHFLWGALSFELMNLFDTFDGRIARLKGFSGKWGMYVDSYCGFYFTFLISLGLAYGLYTRTSNILIWPITFTLYFLLIIHFVEGNVVGFIMGGSESYKKRTQQGQTTSLLGKIRDYTIKKGFREPFNMTDNQHVLFGIVPIFIAFNQITVAIILTIIITFGIILNSTMWFFNYRSMMQLDDKEKEQEKKE